MAMIMDWREMVGKATIEEKVGDYTRLPPSLGRHKAGWRDVKDDESKSNGEGIGIGPDSGSKSGDTVPGEEAALDAKQVVQFLQDPGQQQYQTGYPAADPIRGWILGGAWIAASSAESV